MNQNKINLITCLFEIGAINLNFENYFTFSSGIKSPIYLDFRKTITNPKIRNMILDEFIILIRNFQLENYKYAGLATAGIPWSAFIAEKIAAPLYYIRSEAKGYGTKKQIEGDLGYHQNNNNLVLIEDVITTGKNLNIALNGVQSDSNFKIKKILSIFNYNFIKDPNNQIQSIFQINDLFQFALRNIKIDSKQQNEFESWKKTVSEMNFPITNQEIFV